MIVEIFEWHLYLFLRIAFYLVIELGTNCYLLEEKKIKVNLNGRKSYFLK